MYNHHRTARDVVFSIPTKLWISSSQRDARAAFAEYGVALTAYESGVVRLPMPASEWKPHDVDRLRHHLHAVA